MSFQQGLSGLNGAAKSLDVIGNNIANASTVGFKGSQAQFADVYANSLNGVGGNAAGIGVAVAAIAQQFTQGNIETTNNPLDIAINGAGFFRTEVAGTTQYSRNGQFTLDKQGYMVNAQGAKLTGYMTGPTGAILPGAPEPIKINTADIKARVTTRVDTQINLSSKSDTPTVVPFDADDPDTYNKQIPIDVYDSLGNAHVMSTYYVRTAGGTWDVYVSSDSVEVTNQAVAAAAQTDPASVLARAAYMAAVGAVPVDDAVVDAARTSYADAAVAIVNTAATAAGIDPTVITAIQAVATDAALAGATMTPAQIDARIAALINVPATKVGTLAFDTSGNLTSPLTPLTINLPIFPPTGADPTLSFQLSFAGSTQNSLASSERLTEQDGYAPGQLQRFSAGPDGTIMGQYSNGKSQALGQIVLANFANPNGLTPLGNNAWAESSTSGSPAVGAPTTGRLGNLQSGAVEVSNVDLTAELVNMITAQRVYQANAQTIKTQDSVLQTLVNLR